MKAVVFHGREDLRVENVDDPAIVEPTDAILKITSTAICGSDLHLYNGLNPTMKPGDILGHEFMGEIVEVGKSVKKFKKGDRVVAPFTISCGQCWFCEHQYWSLCDNTNPNKEMMEKMFGHSTAGLFGYSHLFGGYCGGQAQFVRVPHADVEFIKVPDTLTDDQVLFLSDVFPTGYMAAENANIQEGDTVAVWGCGPVGQFTIRSAKMMGAGRIIAIDRFPERLEMAKQAGAETLNYEEVDDMVATLRDMTKGRGPDSCVDAVGMEAHGEGLEGLYDQVKQNIKLETDRPIVLRQIIMACRKGGTLSVPGVYSGFVDKIPMGAFMNKALTMKTGQTHVQKYMPLLLEKIEKGEIDPSFVITHRVALDKAPEMYKTFRDKEDNCIKVVMNPWE